MKIRNIILLGVATGLLLFLSACSTSADPMCHPEAWQDLVLAVPAVPLCAIHDAENQCGPQGCGSGNSGLFAGPNYTILGPGNNVSFAFASAPY
jgi:hypothetical protein